MCVLLYSGIRISEAALLLVVVALILDLYYLPLMAGKHNNMLMSL